MEDLRIVPLLVLGVGALMIWGGLSGQSPVQRIKDVLTKGGVQSAPTETTTTTTTTNTAQASSTYTVRSDYLA